MANPTANSRLCSPSQAFDTLIGRGLPSLPHCAVGETIDCNNEIIPAVAKVRVTLGDVEKGAHQHRAGDDQICMALHSS